MRTLIIGDSHIDDKYIPELEEIFEEIMSIDADAVIHLGDLYNNNRPTPKELDFGTAVAQSLKEKYGDVTILSGNGRHESLHNYHIVSYLHVLGIKLPGMSLRREIDGLNCFFGHYMTNESYREYGNPDITVKELKKYDIVLLGHQHSPQDEKYFHHLGSILYQNFNEVDDPYKRVGIIENGKLNFIQLKTPIPMVDVNSLDALEDLKPNVKARLVFGSFAQFKREIGDVKRYKNKFVDFQTKFDFETNVTKNETLETGKVEKKPLQELIFNEIENIEDIDVKQLLKTQFEEVKNAV